MYVQRTEFTNYYNEQQIKYLDEHTLYMDIETNGLSPLSCSVILIGYLVLENGIPVLYQLFDDIGDDEPLLLTHFANVLSNYDLLIHYNGTQFDVPFLEKRYKKNNIRSPFQMIAQTDLYKDLKPWKNTLCLSHMKLKDLEKVVHFSRQDTIDGEELIKTYIHYLAYKEETVKNRILHHNREDLLSLPFISEIKNLNQLLNGNYSLKNTTIDYDAANEKEESASIGKLSIQLIPECPIPISIAMGKENHLFMGKDSSFQFEIPVYSHGVKVYLMPYKDYYYLPKEDYAIHKSLAKYIDKNDRVKATKENCYLYQQDIDDLVANPDKLKKYVSQLLSFLLC